VADGRLTQDEFEIVNFGYGFVSIYSEIASTVAGQNVITETLVTPFGDFTIPPAFDAAAGFANNMFMVLGDLPHYLSGSI
jgi:hypothetical protein